MTNYRNWELIKLKVSDLKEWSKNPRVLTKKGIEDLRKSITKFGIAEPLVVNRDKVICGGHGRLKILNELNIKDVDCYVPRETLSEKEFEELNLRLNKNIAGEFDFDILANEFDVELLKDVGFTGEEFEELTGENEEKIKQKEEYLKPYKKTHILITIDVSEIDKINEDVDAFMKKIQKIGGIEIEQSSN